MPTSRDPRLDALLQHKGSPVPLEPPRHGTFHNATIDPSRQHQGSLMGDADDPYVTFIDEPPRRGPDRLIGGSDRLYQIGTRREPLKPLYTEKLPTSPAFKSVAELAQRRRDFWAALVGRSGVGLMIAALIIPFFWGYGVFPAGAFVAGLITFAAVCFVSGSRNRNRS